MGVAMMDLRRLGKCAFLAGIVGVYFLAIPAFAESGPPPASATDTSRVADLGRSALANVPSGVIIIGPEDAACTSEYEGALRYSVKHKALLLCDGARWNIVKTEPLTTP